MKGQVHNKEVDRRSYLKHRDARLAKMRERRNSRTEEEKRRLADYFREYRKTHRENIRRYARNFSRRDREKRKDDPEYQERKRAHGRNDYKKHADAYKRRARKWARENRDKYLTCAALSQHKRRARRAESGGVVYRCDLAVLREILGHKCPACGSSASDTVDHVIPLAANGSNHPTNIQFLCMSCNSSKHTKRTDYRTKDQVRRIMQAFQLSMFPA